MPTRRIFSHPSCAVYAHALRHCMNILQPCVCQIRLDAQFAVYPQHITRICVRACRATHAHMDTHFRWVERLTINTSWPSRRRRKMPLPPLPPPPPPLPPPQPRHHQPRHQAHKRAGQKLHASCLHASCLHASCLHASCGLPAPPPPQPQLYVLCWVWTVGVRSCETCGLVRRVVPAHLATWVCGLCDGRCAVQVRRPQLHWDAPSINVSLPCLKRARLSGTSKTHAHAASADEGGIRQEGLKHVLQEMRASISALNHRLDSLAK
jgi:hypothetical protein